MTVNEKALADAIIHEMREGLGFDERFGITGLEDATEKAVQEIMALLSKAALSPRPEQVESQSAGEMVSPAKFRIGDRVTKARGSRWTGRVVGTYSTSLTPEGYAVESETETGSVQIYPAAALSTPEHPQGETER